MIKPSHRDDSGNITLMALVTIIVVMCGFAIVMQFSKVVVEHNRVKNAVELTALAGATDLIQGPEISCSSSRRIAQSNRIVIEQCLATGADIRIRASSNVSIFGRNYVVREVARAGFE